MTASHCIDCRRVYPDPEIALTANGCLGCGSTDIRPVGASMALVVAPGEHAEDMHHWERATGRTGPHVAKRVYDAELSARAVDVPLGKRQRIRRIA